MAKNTPAAAATKSMVDTTLEQEEDAVLGQFFKDVEKLSISSSAVTSHEETAQLADSTQKKQLKTELVNRAESGRQSWQEFSSSNGDDPDRPKISFSISSKKKKTKTRKSRKANGSSSTKAVSTNTIVERVDSSFHRPQWIAVLDTCCVLESYEAVCDLISAAVTTSVEEPMTIVIPYKVWSELDYRSKKLDNEDERYKARRAARMLNKELNKKYVRKTVVRSQSRTEMDKAATEFLGKEDANNDDYILACARHEQEQLVGEIGSLAVGGVVLLTWDVVLSGKATSDRVAVYTPTAFVDYYKRRRASLRERQDRMCWMQRYSKDKELELSS